MQVRKCLLISLLGALVATPLACSRAGAQTTVRVSMASREPDDVTTDNAPPSLSADGRFVAFTSAADNLVPGDFNGWEDVFVRDMQTGTITRVSVATDGTEANDASGAPRISADGRFVVFESYAENLVSNDGNGLIDIFVHDMQTGATTRVNVATDGAEANDDSNLPVISADGRYVAFESYADNLVAGDTNDSSDVFLHDRTTGATTRVSVSTAGAEGDSDSYNAAISASGRYIAFASDASNLVSGDSNDATDIFVRDTTGKTTKRVSISTGGSEADNWSDSVAISSDGRYVAFDSLASNLVAGDTNDSWDVFLRDTTSNTTKRISVSSSGTQGNDDSYFPAVSDDGRYFTFESYATNLVTGDTNAVDDIFLYDRQTAATKRVSVAGTKQGDQDSYFAIPSPNGKFVAFYSDAATLAPDDRNTSADAFRYTVADGSLSRVNVPPAAVEPNGASGVDRPSVSADGRYIAFSSDASNLGIQDYNDMLDVFLYDRQTGAPTRVSIAADGGDTDDDSMFPAVSANGNFVAFTSRATNLVPNDTNGAADVFLWNRATGAITRVSLSDTGVAGDRDSGLSGVGVSADGRYVVFASDATNLVPNDTNRPATPEPSRNGTDVFIRDTTAGTTRRVSVATGGGQGDGDSINPAISADGRFVVFISSATNLVPNDTNGVADAFRHEVATGTTALLSVSSAGTLSNGESGEVDISADGGVAAFSSVATNLAPAKNSPGSGIFVRDIAAGTTEYASGAPTGDQANGNGLRPSLSADGRFVAFMSNSTNLDPGDTNRVNDVFVRDRSTGGTARVSLSADGQEGNAASGPARLSGDGKYVVFTSFASNMVPDDTNGNADVFLRGPLAPIVPPRTPGDVLRMAAGLMAATPADVTTLDANHSGALDLADAVSYQRTKLGLAP